MRWLRPPLPTRLPTAHLGSVPPPLPPPPALCTPGSAGLCSALRGSSRRAGGGGGRSRPGPCSGATPPRAARGLAAAAGSPPAPAARCSRRVPAARPGAGEGEGAGARGDESSCEAERRRKGRRWRGLRPRREGVGGGRGPRREGETHRGHERGRLRCNFGPARRAHLPRFSPRRPGHPSGGWFSFVLFSHTRELQGGD